MSITSGNGYDVEVHVTNVKLADINKYRVLRNNNSTTVQPKQIHRIELDALSFDKEGKLEHNRLISNYTGTLFSGEVTYGNKVYSIDFNKLLPSDLELFSTNTAIGLSDDIQSNGDYSEYLRAVYINDGINDILKIQLNGSNSERILELYKDDTLVITVTYNTDLSRSHIITLSSQLSEDTISNKLHEKEDEYVSTLPTESKQFSGGKGIIHNKVSDCNISYLISDSTKNVLSQVCIINVNNLNSIRNRNLNSSIITNQKRKVFLGVPSM